MCFPIVDNNIDPSDWAVEVFGVVGANTSGGFTYGETQVISIGAQAALDLKPGRACDAAKDAVADSGVFGNQIRDAFPGF
ncbi:hypothetical protein JYT71_00005 [Acidimicrobiaceae bacterium AH-315-P05]|nr:hypothetical protein [Acidimicrobiaceae bacterium AH-315-P05]